MSSDQPSTSKAATKNNVAGVITRGLRYECLHLKEVQQLRASLGSLKKDYGDILIRTTNLIQKLAELDERIKKLESKAKP